MPQITLKGGTVKVYPAGVTPYEIAKDLSEGLARNACAAAVDGATVDLRHPITADAEVTIYTFDDPEGRRAYRHTASHVLAQAVKRLYPEVKLAIGPATDEGFYYDFDRDRAFVKEEIDAIEEEMKKIIKEDLALERFELPRAEAIALMERMNEPYKVELIQDLPEDAVISFYKQGDYTDLCAGPHLLSTKQIKSFKLLGEGGSSGAYWRGSEKNRMLSRIYGTAYTKAADLDAYLKAREEARARNHNKLGRELKFFTTSDIIGQGLPLLMPRGAKVVQLMQRWVEDEEERRGYLLTKTPFMSKSDLYKISGHWDHYRDGMFILGDAEKDEDEEVYALRPMTCPFQFTIYNAEQHSYRDLPIRYNETSYLFRNEASGEMHGLTRVRQFTLSEGHLVCTPEQLKAEFAGILDLIRYCMNTLGFAGDVTYRFSKWDVNHKEDYLGDEATWEMSQALMRDILTENGIDFYEADGEAAFYGPKLDIQGKNVFGKEDTLITVQVDFALAERFNMTYIDADGVKKHPIVLHRSSVGSYERTLAMLIEKYGGAFPLWLAPEQAMVLPISDKYAGYAQEIIRKLQAAGLRAQGDFRGEKIGYKIREARLLRTPYILVVGENEEKAGTVSVRSRHVGDEGSMKVEDLISRLQKEVSDKVNNAGVTAE